MKPVDVDPSAPAENQVQEWTCPEHGVTYGENKPDPRRMTWECPECRRSADRAWRAFQDERARHHWWWKQSGVPARYRAATPASIQPVTPTSKAMARAVVAYTANLQQRLDAGAGLVLIGPPGLGKTVALTAVINAACAFMRGPIYASWPDVVAELKAGFSGPRDDPRRKAVERLREAPFLALDELGVKGATDFEHAELFGLIDFRYREQFPLLAAANATPANFASLVGERIVDRLREAGPELVMKGESLRGQVSIDGPDALSAPPESITIRVHAHGQWRERTIEHEASGW